MPRLTRSSSIKPLTLVDLWICKSPDRGHRRQQLTSLRGPNWIHGTNQNAILDIARETNTVTFNPEGDSLSTTVDQYGHIIPESKDKEHNEIMWSVVDDAFKYSREDSASIPQDRSLLDYFEARIKEQSIDPASSEIVLQMVTIWGNYIGSPIERQSLKYLWLEDVIDGGMLRPDPVERNSLTMLVPENLFCASTYKAILDHVARSALADVDLHLSTKVTKIVTNEKLSLDHPLRIAVSTNKEDAPFLYDEIVLTVPLGYLKRNLAAFSPPLPDPLTNAITNASYGRLEKVYVMFPSAYWSQEPANEKQEPFFTHFLHPTYAKQNPQAWNMDCASLADLPEGTGHPTLLFYIHGDCAEYITSLINGLSPDSHEYYDRLQPFFEPYYSRLAHYSPSSKDCIPSGFLATNWQNDEFAGYGSYSNFQVSDSKEEILLDEIIETMRKGDPERGLWFAGEHTAPFIALGTVTGAYWSGDAVARRILKAYDMVVKDKKQIKGGDAENHQDKDLSNVEGKLKGTVIGL